MKLLSILLATMISGCATSIPVTAKFPEPPGRRATEPCPDLQKLGTDAKLSDVARTVAMNYTTYHECAVKADAWIQWYHAQKLIFESAGK